jgi:hypothetical protein
VNTIERFRAVCRGESVDYVPILGLPGAPGLAFGGAWGEIYRRLVATGMPESVAGWTEENAFVPKASLPWSEYWGTLSPITVPFCACDFPGEVKSEKLVKDGYEIIEYETGAVTRQVVDNDDAYSMPSFQVHHVRDRESWETYQTLMSPSTPWSEQLIADRCQSYLKRDRPLCMNLGSTWGSLRDLMGVEAACTIIYDEPELAADIIHWHQDIREKYQYPLMAFLRPEIVILHEDCCYNNGMMISPRHLEQFCGAVYRDIASITRSLEVEMFAVDSDGDVSTLIPKLRAWGANALYPLEAKSNRDLIKLRADNPGFILMGGLEKEVVNEGNEDMMATEIEFKVPPLLKQGRYFPNIDHTLQPMCTYDNVCRFMTLLHDTLNNPEGKFPRLCTGR